MKIKMKKLSIVILIVGSLLGMTSSFNYLKDNNYDIVLFGYTPSIPLLERYRLPHFLSITDGANYTQKIIFGGSANVIKAKKHKITKDSIREEIYDPLEYPLFKYPFHYFKDVSTGLNAYATSFPYNDYLKPDVTRYAAPCSITIYQPEFAMLKRFFSPTKFSFKKIIPDLNYVNDTTIHLDGEFFWDYFGLFSNFGSIVDLSSRITPGYPQGFLGGLTPEKFDVYYVSNAVDDFFLIVPKNIKTSIIFKEEWLGILFVGTSLYLSSEEYFNSPQNKEYVNNRQNTGYYNVIDVVVLYDTKFVDYVRL